MWTHLISMTSHLLAHASYGTKLCLTMIGHIHSGNNHIDVGDRPSCLNSYTSILNEYKFKFAIRLVKNGIS